MAFKIGPPKFQTFKNCISKIVCWSGFFFFPMWNLWTSKTSPKFYKPSKPFSIIHSDVWGSNRINSLSNKRWFITFTDDHTRLCWVYLLKEKSEVGQIVKKFIKLVHTQFNSIIQVFRTDNGTEYFNTVLGRKKLWKMG